MGERCKKLLVLHWLWVKDVRQKFVKYALGLTSLHPTGLRPLPIIFLTPKTPSLTSHTAQSVQRFKSYTPNKIPQTRRKFVKFVVRSSSLHPTGLRPIPINFLTPKTPSLTSHTPQSDKRFKSYTPDNLKIKAMSYAFYWKICLICFGLLKFLTF